MKIEDLSKQFKEYNDLLIYSDAQYKTILSQSKEINSLKEKVKELEKLLTNSVPLIKTEGETSIRAKIDGLTDEEAVAVIEIGKLKDLSMERELTIEEAKRYQIYTQALNTLRSKQKVKEKESTDNVDDASLLAALSELAK